MCPNCILNAVPLSGGAIGALTISGLFVLNAAVFYLWYRRFNRVSDHIRAKMALIEEPDELKYIY